MKFVKNRRGKIDFYGSRRVAVQARPSGSLLAKKTASGVVSQGRIDDVCLFLFSLQEIRNLQRFLLHGTPDVNRRLDALHRSRGLGCSGLRAHSY